MSEDMEQIHFKQGELIFKEGDSPGGVYLISKGQVEISKTKKNQKLVLAVRSFNDIFGEMALVDSEDRSATALALEDTWCYQLSREDFDKRLKESDPFIQGIIKVLSKTVRDVTEGQVQMKVALSECEDKKITAATKDIPPVIAELEEKSADEEEPADEEDSSSTTGF